MQTILDRMRETPLIFDGAMGTMLYERGVFLNACFDELCLSNPKIVRQIHQEYLEAGAEVIETNTFGANRIALRGYGLGDRVEAINREGVRIAREVAGDSAYVAAAVGPCIRTGQILLEGHADEVEASFAEQVGALAAEGGDLVGLEAFTGLSAPPLAESVAESLSANAAVDAVGINCGTGPAGAFDALPSVLSATTKPVVVMPNAGFPRDVGGRMIYLTSPEYFTEYAKKYIELGVRGVGGCCGTTPAPLRMATPAINSLSGLEKHVEIRPLV